MKITYDVRMTAQNQFNREYSIEQVTEGSNSFSREFIYTSPYKGLKGMHDCFKMIQKIKQAF